MPDPLAIIPSYVRTPDDVEILMTTLRTLRETEPLLEVLVVDDASPYDEGLEQLGAAAIEQGFQLHRRSKNEGFAKTVNVGLRHALERDMDAVLVNADIEFEQPWLYPFQADDADLMGALLLYPDGTIQHAGVYFSRLLRVFDHRFRHGPGDLLEAREPQDCIVTAALQYIRLGTLHTVGVYDETFQMGYEDVDYCLRVFQAGLRCRYVPAVTAIHHESVFRGRPSPKVDDWQKRSFMRLVAKWPQAEMLKYAVPLV